MGYFVIALVGFGSGGALVYFLLESWRKRLAETQQKVATDAKSLHEQTVELSRERQAFAQKFDEYQTARTAFDQQAVSYQELADENHSLKRDLSALHQTWRKAQQDSSLIEEFQVSQAKQIQDFGARYLRDQEKWISSSLNQNNYASCKQRLTDVIARSRDLGLLVSPEEEGRLFADLKKEYELAVRAALEREEQAGIKAQIREEQKRERDIQRAIEQAAREKAIVEAALQRALAAAQGQHSAEVESLRAQLAEAEARSQRAISQAQLTRAGNVYIISNVGSFGEGVFKIGMTRRLEPMDRVAELSGASVPFPFDVHLMIASHDAPALETALHRAFHKQRINKINLRKEFFRVSLDEIIATVTQHHGDVVYRADVEALQYRNSLEMTDEDLEMLEEVYEEEDEENPAPDEL